MITLKFTKKDKELISKMENSTYFEITASNTNIRIGGYDIAPRYFKTVSSAYKYFVKITE